MIEKEKKKCCGCGICEIVCGVGAIKMKEDSEGFLYPNVDVQKCIRCGKCVKVCSFYQDDIRTKSTIYPIVYAVKHKSDEVRFHSSSGGVFTALSDAVLNRSGQICGAGLDAEMNVVHKMAYTRLDRDELRSSKYVQSNILNASIEIKNVLKDGSEVLFIGTPCQCAAIRGYIREDKNLYLCDLLCRGVASPRMWSEHIRRLKKKGNIVRYEGRSKIRGWESHTEAVTYKDGRVVYRSALSQEHKVLFQSHMMLRPSCYYCCYTNLSRPSDITIGDFWGIERSMADFKDNKGVSVVLVNTEKGKQLFERIKKDIQYRESTIEDCMQPSLYKPVEGPMARKKFWEEYEQYGYDYITKKYGGCSLMQKIKTQLKLILKK